jgi:predicted ferric reductase
MNRVSAGVLIALYVLWPSYQAVDYILVQPFAGVLDMANYVASIFSYDWLLLNVLLGLKLPVLQRLVPYDLRIRAHILSTVLMAGFLVWHTVYYLVLNPKDINVVTWGLMAAFLLMVLLSAVWSPVPGARRLWLAARRVLARAYEVLKTTHKGLYLVLAGLAWWHILDAKIIGVASPVSSWGFEGLFVLAAAAWALTRFRNLALPSLPVLSASTSGGVVKLVLGQGGRLSYRPGQYAFLRFAKRGLRGEEHPFSFVSAGGPTVEFAAKEVGDFTKKLKYLAPGDRVRVNAGFGNFRPRSDRPLLLVGTGVGYTPLLSVLRDLAARGHTGEVRCYLAATRAEELPGAGEWDALRARMPGLQVRTLLSEQNSPRLETELSGLDEPGRYECWLCSSARVRSGVVSKLRELGVPRRHIHFEAFNWG